MNRKGWRLRSHSLQPSDFILRLGDTEVAMNGNGRPLGTRKKVQILVALTILAWATQTLMHQWGFGAEVPAGGPAPAALAPEVILPAEKFLPGPRAVGGGTLELRGEATVVGA